MARLAGETIRASDESAIRVGTDKQVTNSATVTTTETPILWSTCSLVQGGRYAVNVHVKISTTVAGDNATVRIREDDETGTVLQEKEKDIPATSPSMDYTLYTEYVSPTTQTKVFVGTVVRAAGSGNITRTASATLPSFLTVDRVA